MSQSWQVARSAVRASTILAVVALGALAGCGRSTPTAATAPAPTGEKVYRLGIGYFGPDEACENAIAGYLDGLKEEGIEQGRNLEVIRRHAASEIGQLPQMMQALDAQALDLILPMSTPAVAAAVGAVKNTPMVFVYTYDPIGAGAGKSVTDHLPNLTGVASFPPIEGTMDVILQLFPNAKTIGTIYNASEANSVKAVSVARGILSAKGVALEEVTIAGTGEVLLGAQALAARKPDVVWVTGDNTVLQALDGVIKPMTDAKLPLVLNDPEFVNRGALLGVGIGWHPSGLAAGKMAARVLRGESPAGMPILELAKRRIVLNQELAQKLGIVFPPALIEEAAHPPQ